MVALQANLVHRLLAAFVAAVLVRGSPSPVQAKGAGAVGWKLAHHSFERTLTYDDGLGDWLSSAATMALRDRVQVMPPVPDRYGLFWSKKAVKTRDFEVAVRFKAEVAARSDGSGPAETDGAFAFWLGPENFSESYNEQAIVTTSKNWWTGLEKAGLTFLGRQPTFKGLAIVFTDLGAGGKKRPAVTALWNDGSKTESLKSVLDKADDSDTKAAVQWLEKTLVVLRVRVKPDGSVNLKLTKESLNPDMSPEDLFNGKLPAGTIPATQTESYFGLSGWSGSPEKKTQLAVDVDRFESRNFDESKVGEDGLAGLEDIGGAEWLKVLEGEKRFISQAAQKEAVDRLTKLLKTHVDRYSFMGSQLKTELGGLETRLEAIGSDMGVLSTELQAYDPKTHTINAESVKEHLKGIHQILAKDKADGSHKKLQEVEKIARDLKKKGVNELNEEGKVKLLDAAEQSRLLEKQSTEGSSQTNVLLVMLMVVVAGLFLLFLSRMRYYEKKHYI